MHIVIKNGGFASASLGLHFLEDMLYFFIPKNIRGT